MEISAKVRFLLIMTQLLSGITLNLSFACIIASVEHDLIIICTCDVLFKYTELVQLTSCPHPGGDVVAEMLIITFETKNKKQKKAKL